MIWGLSYLDFSILIAFLIVILAVGIHASRSVKHQADFFLGGRKFGKALQFFLNFGNATDTNAAPTMASQVYSRGVSGIWLQLQTLLFTPLFWFTQPWFRRARVTTMADLFIDRYNSQAAATAYAIFNVMVALLTLGLGNLGGYSVVDAMMVKPAAAYTPSEASEVAGFNRLQALKSFEATRPLTDDEKAERVQLQKRADSGELRGQIPALSKTQFYVGYNLIIAIFIMLGGLKAAAITDAIQGVLILFMSIILLPLGLWKVGGFHGLHATIADPSKFLLTGTQFSTFTWYSIAAFTFASFIQIVGLQHNMSAAGSATNENTARFGMITGGFTKRIILICWMMCGLLALALLRGEHQLDVPDFAWGRLSSLLLPAGLTGIMLSGMLLGHMPAVGLTAVAVSGLVVRNIYTPMVKGRDSRHYLRVGQLIIVFVLAASIGIAWNAQSLRALTAKMILFNTFFGAVFLLLFFWRRLTVPAILISFGIWLVVQLIMPLAVGFSALNHNDALVMRTRAHETMVKRAATAADVAAGRADREQDIVAVPATVPPSVMFFDGLRPRKDAEGSEGTGFFIAENFVMYHILKPLGIDMQQWTVAQIETCRYLFDGLFPFLSLMVLSFLTGGSAPERAGPFYAKMKTPVAPTPELDHEEVEKSRLNPERFDDRKLFPGTNWEFAKWRPQDYVGFFGCCAIVFVILGLLFLVLHLGA